MESFDVQVVFNGRITIPKKIRKRLNLKDGDHVRVQLKKLVLKEARS